MPVPNPLRSTRVGILLLASGLLVAAHPIRSAIATGPPEARSAGDSAQHQVVPQSSFPTPPQSQGPGVQPDTNPAPLTPKQQRAVLKASYAKMKQDADELEALAKSLQEDLNKSNENVLSLGIVEKADKIDKLAKKIKNAALQ